MQNAKHTGYMWALAVALGVGMAVATTPAVASADPGNSDKGSSEDSGSSTSSDTSSKKSESTTNDGPRGQRRGLDSSGEKAEAESTDPDSTADAPEGKKDDERPSGRATSRTESDSEPEKSDVTEPVAAALSPFSPSPPNERVEQSPASALLTLSRRDLEPGSSTPSTSVNPPVTNGLVADDADVASDEVSVVAEPGFVSSTRGFFGLFSLTSAGDPEDNNYVAVVFRTPFFTMVLTSGTDPEDNLGLGAATIGVAGQTVFTFLSPFVTFSAGIPIEDPFAELFIDLIRAGII